MESYVIIRSGYCLKKAVTLLVPLTDITDDPDREVTVISLKGATTVRAGDFFLGKGVKDEIRAIPKEGIDDIMMPDDLFQTYNKKSGHTLLIDTFNLI